MRLKVTNPALVQAIVLHLSLNDYKVDANIQPKVRPDLIDREVEISIDTVAKRVANWLSEPKGTIQTPDVTTFQEFLERFDANQNPITIASGLETHTVVIKKDGVQVGCTFVPWETIEKIVARKPKS
jgi:hypothetical protein